MSQQTSKSIVELREWAQDRWSDYEAEMSRTAGEGYTYAHGYRTAMEDVMRWLDEPEAAPSSPAA